MTEEGPAKEALPAGSNGSADEKTTDAKNVGGADSATNMFKGENILKDDVIPADEASSANGISTNSAKPKKDLVVKSVDKVAFIKSMVENRRFEKVYSIFGGNVTLVVRSLTNEEVQAMAAFVMRMSVDDPSGAVSGKYRKYLLDAHVAKFNDIELPPLKEPLFRTIGDDGKSVVDPGWVSSGSFWDDKPYGLVQAAVACVEEFNVLYNSLCEKAEDANFWSPDTH